MTDTVASAVTASRKRIRIFVNNEPFFALEPVMTGAEILALAAVAEGNQLFLEVPGPGDDRPIPPEEAVELRPGMKFYDVPIGTFG